MPDEPTPSRPDEQDPGRVLFGPRRNERGPGAEARSPTLDDAGEHARGIARDADIELGEDDARDARADPEALIIPTDARGG